MDIERPKNIQQGPPVTKLVTSRDSHNNSVNNTVICSSSLSNATFILHLDLELIILVYQIITEYTLYAVTSLYMKQLQLSHNCVFLYYILSEIDIRTVRSLHSSFRPSNQKLRYARDFMTHNIRSKQPALVIILYLCLPSV